MHEPSLETYKDIADWIGDFPYSLKDKWYRMGFVGVFADYVLSSLPGDILEIGTGESSIYLTKLSLKYGRKIYYCDIEPGKIINPLTVPGYLNPDGVFFQCSSDKMFETSLSPLAFVFIDGDHSYKQVKKDFWNAYRHLVEDGFILLHDTYPPDLSWTNDYQCGEVYKLRLELEKDERFDCVTLTRGTAMNVGLTIVRKRHTERKGF